MSDTSPPAAPAPVPPLPGTPGHAADLTTRFAMGIFLIAVALGAIWLGGWPFRALVLVGAAIMFAEWAEMHKAPWLWTWVGVALMAILLLGGMEYVYPVGDADTVPLGFGEEMLSADFDLLTFATLAAPAIAAGGLLALVARRASVGWGFVYIAVPSLALLVLDWTDPIALVLWVMVVTWSTDIGAFFAGRAIGGPKLAPKISPAKTWAGLIGGMIVAGGLGYLMASYLELDLTPDAATGEPHPIYQAFLWLGAPMAIVAQAGDLYESWVKRRCGVKDSGTILPGHGGVLDRCDGLIAVAFATLLYLMIGLWLS